MNGEQLYLFPMHSDVRQKHPGKCPRCGMDLIVEGTRFGLLRHMFSNPLHLAEATIGAGQCIDGVRSSPAPVCSFQRQVTGTATRPPSAAVRRVAPVRDQ